MVDFFNYNNATGRLEFNRAEILLVPEFEALMDKERNACKEDPEGRFKLRAWREFKYIYLMESWKSPFSEYPEQDRHKRALTASKLSDTEIKDAKFLAALRYFKEIKESSRAYKLLSSAYTVIDKLNLYFQTLDMEERKEDGSLVYKAKDVIAEINALGATLDKLKESEIRYKKDLEEQKKIKGDQQPGFSDLTPF